MPRINAARGEMAIEKSPSYFVTEAAPARVRNMSAKAKLLLVVRWVGIDCHPRVVQGLSM